MYKYEWITNNYKIGIFTSRLSCSISGRCSYFKVLECFVFQDFALKTGVILVGNLS